MGAVSCGNWFSNCGRWLLVVVVVVVHSEWFGVVRIIGMEDGNFIFIFQIAFFSFGLAAEL